MMLTMAVSTQLFHAPITPQLVLAVTLVATSTLQYNLPRSLLRDSDEAEAALLGEKRQLMLSGNATDDSSAESENLDLPTPTQSSGRPDLTNSASNSV